MSVQLRLGLIVGLVCVASSSCFAFQSGSRGSAPAATPAPAFSAPQSPVISPNASSLQLQSPSVQ